MAPFAAHTDIPAFSPRLQQYSLILLICLKTCKCTLYEQAIRIDLEIHFLYIFARYTKYNPLSVCVAAEYYPIPTYSAVDVGLCPHRVVLLVDHFGSAQHVQIFHHVLLYVRQGGNLSEVAWEAGK